MRSVPLHLRVPRMRTKVLAGVSHWLMVDTPEAFRLQMPEGQMAADGSARP